MRFDDNSRQITEEDLIAYQMGECSRLRAWQIRRALEADPELAEEAASIAATLRAFSSEPAPRVDSALQDRMWQNLRPSLAVLEPAVPEQKGKRSLAGGWAIGLGGALAGAALVLLLLTRVHLVPVMHPGSTGGQEAGVQAAPPVEPQVDEAQQEIERIRPSLAQRDADKPQYYHGRPGPVTVDPVEEVATTEGGLATHLDTAERVLTEVSHEEGPMPAVTHHEVHRLLVENAVYQQRARGDGDYAAAAVMDDLGRVLTSLDADPPKTASGLEAFRLEFNVGGVLFDLRVLHDDRGQSR